MHDMAGQLVPRPDMQMGLSVRGSCPGRPGGVCSTGGVTVRQPIFSREGERDRAKHESMMQAGQVRLSAQGQDSEDGKACL